MTVRTRRPDLLDRMDHRWVMLATIAVVVMICIGLSMDRARAQTPALEGGIVFAPNVARTVTISKNGALRGSFTLPTGTFLLAQYDKDRPNSITPDRWEFHGNVVLHAQASGEMPPPGGGIFQRMNQAPMVLTLQDMDVVIENSR